MGRQFLFYILLCSIFFSCGTKSDADKHLKIFRFNVPEGLSSLDPAFARSQATRWATEQMFNGLVELDDKLTVQPALATSWAISEDKKEYTFKLRKGIHFHDHQVFPNGLGREVKASDFVYSFKRIIDPAISSTGAWIFNDKLLINADGSFADNALEAVDDYTLKIRLQKPFPPFLQILSMPYAYVVPKEAVEKYGKEFTNNPVGTGPFKFQLWDESSALVLLKNDKYWKRDVKGKQLPYLDAVQVSFINDLNAAFLAFLHNKLDFITGIEDNSRDLLLDHQGQLKAQYIGKFSIQKLNYLNTEYLGFQLDPAFYQNKQHPLLDKRVRQAMNYAVNRKELLTYFRNSLGTVGNSGIVPSSLPSFDANKVPGYEYNIAKAQQLLREAGYNESKKMEPITLATIAPYKLMAEYLQKEWSNIGIRVNIEVDPAATNRALIDNGKVNFFRASWLGDYADGENYLSLFYSKNFSPAGPNKTHFASKEFDRLYQLSQKETDEVKRNLIYQEMEQVMLKDSPVIILYYDELLRLVQNNITGLAVNPMNNLSLEKVDLH